MTSRHDAPGASAGLGTYDRLADAWLDCIDLILRRGQEVHDDGVPLKELLNVSFSAQTCDPAELIAAGASAGRLNLMIEKYASPAILPMYRMSYGKLFREHAGVDQVDWLVQRLKLRPEAKSATIGFHLPGDDVLSCISLVDCKLRSGRLYLTGVFRSQNAFASQPGNAVALSRIQHEIAAALDVAPGPLTLHVMSAHIYQEDWAAAGRLVSARRRSRVRNDG